MRLERVTPAQVRAARAMLGWSGKELIERTGLSHGTLNRFMSTMSPGEIQMRVANLERLISVLEDAGIEFFSDDERWGVTLSRRSSGSVQLDGAGQDLGSYGGVAKSGTALE